MAKVLVVDDEENLVASLRYMLSREGFQVCTAADGASALEVARREGPDLVILDIMLPDVDGFEVCRRLRQESAVPILMLTAKVEEVDKVVGLELGADDYVTKPFSMRELLARVRALLRRARPPEESPPPIVAGDLKVSLASREAFLGGEPLSLQPKEFDLLAFLAGHPDRVFTRRQLLEQVWGSTYVDARTVDVHVRWLRKKIERDPSHPRRIETVRGVGYRFRRAG